MNLREAREQYNLSQIEAAIMIGVPIRTLRRYEQDDNYGSEYKRQMFIDILRKNCEITEEKGLLTVEYIRDELVALFDGQYKGLVDFCYLFGSYAKGYASEKSDVDLCVSTSLTGLEFVGLSESIRNLLRKKIDLIRFDTLKNNFDLIDEIMKDGIKIFK